MSTSVESGRLKRPRGVNGVGLMTALKFSTNNRLLDILIFDKEKKKYY